MSTKSVPITPELYTYILNHWVREPDVLRRLREETSQLPNSAMQIGPEQGPILAILVQLIGAKKGIELGTFTGYSSTAVALALPDDGRLICCDVNADTTAVARRYWREAGVEHKIELVLGPALDTLNRLLAEGGAGTYDFAFIDADKTNYPAYWEKCIELIRPNGIILIDNVLWHGRLVDPAVRDADTEALRTINQQVFRDERVDVALIPVADGLTIARKR